MSQVHLYHHFYNAVWCSVQFRIYLYEPKPDWASSNDVYFSIITFRCSHIFIFTPNYAISYSLVLTLLEAAVSNFLVIISHQNNHTDAPNPTIKFSTLSLSNCSRNLISKYYWYPLLAHLIQKACLQFHAVFLPRSIIFQIYNSGKGL